MKTVKNPSLTLLLLLVVILFPLNPLLAAFLVVISLGTAILDQKK